MQVPRAKDGDNRPPRDSISAAFSGLWLLSGSGSGVEMSSAEGNHARGVNYPSTWSAAADMATRISVWRQRLFV